MFKKIAALTLATLALAACGASTPDAELYEATGFDVTVTEAQYVDLTGYGTDLYAMYATFGVTNCEEGLSDRDINNAMYLGCPGSPVDIRIHADAALAKEALDFRAEEGLLTGLTYRTDNYVIQADNAVMLNGALDSLEAGAEG